MDKTIALALTGASGIVYGWRLLECLLEAGCRVQLLYSQAAQIVSGMESDIHLPASAKEAEALLHQYFECSQQQLRVFGRQQWMAPVASGSNPPDALVVCPCTTGTLASIAQGICHDLIDRAADVVLKERRPLILVVRETPYSEIHLQNMLTITRAGGLIMPASPGFYHHPKHLGDLVDFMVARILDQLAIPHDLFPRWGNDSKHHMD